MRNILSLLVVLLATSCSISLIDDNKSGPERVITLSEPGTLYSLIREEDRDLISKITIIGPLNGSDLALLHAMTGMDSKGSVTSGILSEIDLKNATISSGGDPVYIRDNQVIYSEDNWLPSGVFWGGKRLKKIVLPTSVSSMGSHVFYQCSSLESIVLPSMLKQFGEWSFYECESLKNIEIPEEIKTVPDFSFANCINLVSVSTSGKITSILDYAFGNCSRLEEILDISSVSKIGEGAFAFCRSLKEVKIPNGIQKIPVNLFYKCSSITNISLPESLEAIGDSAFYECKQLKNINLPSGLKTIGEFSFFCSGLINDLKLPQSLEYLGSSAFASTNITKLYVNSNIQTNYNDSWDGASFARCHMLTDVIVSEGCTDFNLSFNPSLGLKHVSLPKSLRHIGYGDGISRGLYAFACTSLEEINLPDSLDYIAPYTFYCSEIKTIRIPDGVKDINANTFGVCIYLEQVDLNKVENICDSAFCSCSITTINLPPSLHAISNYSFLSCNKLKAVAIPDGVTTIGESVFEQCEDLESVSIGIGVQSIPASCFSECLNLKTIDFPGTLSSIGPAAFYKCLKLKSIYIPRNVNVISDYAFSYSGLLGITVDWNTPIEINDNVFDGMQKDQVTLYVPKGSILLYKDSNWGSLGFIQEKI